MDEYDLYQALNVTVRRSNEALEKSERELAELRATLGQVIHILTGKGILNQGHERLIERIAGDAARAVRPKVRLRQFLDKYKVPNADVDCASRLHLCHARCCSLSFELSLQDLDEGKVRWEVEEPYLIRHERDGFCSHLERSHADFGGCTVYHNRPAACRSFDCRNDPRIWEDFAAGLPAPLPAGLSSPRAPGPP